MKRSFGAVILLAVLTAPALVTPVLLVQPPAETPDGGSTAREALGEALLQDSDSRATVFGAPSDVFYLRLDEASSESDARRLARASLTVRDYGVAPDAPRSDFAARDEEAVVHRDSGDAGPASEPSVPLHAIVLMEMHQTLLAVGISAQPHLGAAAGAAFALGRVAGQTFGPALLTETSETGPVPGWLLHATWILLLVAIGLTLRPGMVGAALGLFSRFDRSDVLHHERRSRLFAAIEADPGANLGELCRSTSLAAGVAQHHLRLLEQHELVRRVRDGRSTRFYPRGPRFAPPALRNETRQRLVELVVSDPTLDARTLAQRLGQRPQSTWHHLHLLCAAGVLTPLRCGRSVRWQANL